MEVSGWISEPAIPRTPKKLDVRVRVRVTKSLFGKNKAPLPDWGQKSALAPERRMVRYRTTLLRRAKGVINNNYFHSLLCTPQ